MTSRRTIAATGAAASMLVHGLLVTPLFLGYGQHPRRHPPDVQGAAASHQNETSAIAMTAVFIDDDHAIATSGEADTSIAHFRLPRPALRPVAVAPVAIAHLNLPLDDITRPASEANGDESGHSMMFGRYMGQITARVERAWLRPRSVPTGGVFACRVQITQDERGNVQEVMLQKCTADPSWQVSLMRAISSASPLPAPPDAAVFANTLILEFDSDPYLSGDNGPGFEPATRMAAPVATSSIPSVPSSSEPQPGTITRRLRPDGSIDLTIIGSNAAQEPLP